jgi:hypothetical protein
VDVNVELVVSVVVVSPSVLVDVSSEVVVLEVVSSALEVSEDSVVVSESSLDGREWTAGTLRETNIVCVPRIELIARLRILKQSKALCPNLLRGSGWSVVDDDEVRNPAASTVTVLVCELVPSTA